MSSLEYLFIVIHHLRQCIDSVLAQTHPDEDSAITVRRIKRRLQLVDGGGARTLWQDLLAPPAVFLEWRWNDTNVVLAGLKHYRQLMKKAVGL